MQANPGLLEPMGPEYPKLRSIEGPVVGVAVARIWRSCIGKATAGCP